MEKKLSASNGEVLLSDYCKGVAIMMVMLVHSQQVFVLPETLSHTLTFAQAGTQIFFVLSSFGLCFSYGSIKPSWFSFMKRRISKLLPMYWTAIVVTALYHVVFAVLFEKNVFTEINMKGIAANMLFLHGFFHDEGVNNLVVRGGWFVGTIVIYYMLFPALYKLYFRGNRYWVSMRPIAFPIFAIILSWLLSIAMDIWTVPVLSDNLIKGLTAFALGFSLYDVKEKGVSFNLRIPKVISVIFLIGAIAVYYLDLRYSFIYLSLFACAFLFAYVYIDHQFARRGEKQTSFVGLILYRYGKRSYEIYLFHTFVVYDVASVLLLILRKLCSSDLLIYIVLLPIVYIVSYCVGETVKLVVERLCCAIIKQ